MAQEKWSKVESDNECLTKTIWQLKTKAAKRKDISESFWTKAVTCPPEKKNQKKETDTPSWQGSSLSVSSLCIKSNIAL